MPLGKGHLKPHAIHPYIGVMLDFSNQKRLTLSEASFVTGSPRATLDRAIEKGEIKAIIQAKHGRVRTLDLRSLRAFYVQSKFARLVTPVGRKGLERAVAKTPLDKDVAYWNDMIVSLAPIDAKLTKGLAQLAELKLAVVTDAGGVPVLKGTDIPVHQISALAAGQGVEATLEDYPNLKPEQVQTAVDYAKAYPKTGRPFPAKSFKRAIADAATAGAFDIDTADIAVTPDDFR